MEILKSHPMGSVNEKKTPSHKVYLGSFSACQNEYVVVSLSARFVVCLYN